MEFVSGWCSNGKDGATQCTRKTQVMPRVSFHRFAEPELNDAAVYYEHESPGLGIAFLNEVETYVESVVKNPNAGTKIRGQVRSRLLRRFPYGILYSLKADGIRIQSGYRTSDLRNLSGR